MRKITFALVTMGILAIAAGCGPDNSGAGRGCGNPGGPASCGMSCTGDASCGADTYCSSEGRCTADCVAGGTTCGAGRVCGSKGRCVNGDGQDGGTPFDRDGACAVLGSQATLEKSPVDVILVVDNSGSMADEIIAIQ